MRKNTNFFTAALESEAGSVDVGDIHTLTTLQPKKLGVGKDGEEVEEKPEGEIGVKTPDIAKHDEIDAVAESQEHTLALEHLHQYAQRHMRMANALEELSEQVDDRLEEGNPLNAGETAMLTTAVDAAGIGEPLGDSVALEAFEFSDTVATEAFSDALKERAGQVKEAVLKFVKRTGEEVEARGGVLSSAFKKYPDRRIAPLKKKISAVNGVSGRNFENASVEKAIQAKIYANSSSKNPIAALKDALAAYDAAMTFIDTRVVSAVAQMNRTYNTEGLDKQPAAVNKVLAATTELANKHSANSPYTTFKVTVTAKTVTPETADKVGFDSVRRVVAKPSYDNSLKIASEADLEELASLVAKASRVFGSKMGEAFLDVFKFLNAQGKVGHVIVGDGKSARVQVKGEGRWTETKAWVAYRSASYSACRAISLVETGLAEAVFRNANAAAEWISASITEANAARK